MDNKFDMDKIMYLIGQEDAMAELDKFTEPHGFSKEYESEKMKMFKKENNIEPMPSRKGKGMMRKKLIVLIAAVTATLAISITAYGVCQKILFTASIDEEAGTVTYDVESETEINEIPLINITPEYLPEGYLPLKNAPGKYSPNGEPSAEGGILIYQNDYICQPKSSGISNLEETIIGGVKAYISTSEDKLYKYKIELIYEEDGQIITVGGSCSLDELKKVAENIKYEVVPGRFLNLYDPNSDEVYIPPIDPADEVYIAPAVPADQVFNLGEELKYDMFDESPMFTINKLEIMDKLPEVNPDYFWNYDEYLEAINEDGTLKDYERRISIKRVKGKVNYVTETAGRKFAYVNLTLRNPFDKELKDIIVCPMIDYRTKSADGTLEAFPGDRRSGNDIVRGEEPIYFDQSDYSKDHFFFCDLEPNETKEINLIYFLDEDHIDDAYLTQRGRRIRGQENNFVYYFKMK